MKRRSEVAFEESLSEDWSKDLDVIEIPLDKRPLFSLGVAVFGIGIIIAARLIYLGLFKHSTYEVRAEANLNATERISAPRAIISDRYGKSIAENKLVFRALLDPKEFLKHKELQEPTLETISDVLGIDGGTILQTLKDKKTNLNDFTLPMILSPSLTESQLLDLKSRDLKTIILENGYVRDYPYGSTFASVIGYTSLANPDDLKDNPNLTNEDFVGKAGLEAYYDKALQGTPGEVSKMRNAKGEILGNEEKIEPQAPKPLRTTLDAEFQKYFYNRLQEGLKTLNRTTGVGIAINPQTGEILAMTSIPSYNPNIFLHSASSSEIKDVLTSPLKPLFDRAVSGTYSPGSTIKPLVGVAALAENVISTSRTIFSPGYLDIPNPYNPSKPTRYLDWRYQGDVNMASAIAQSSDVYFYEVAGGWGDIRGIGISKLVSWWQKFGLGKPTGVDVPNEAAGFLPTPDWKQKRSGTPWLLGDTFNVSIGQGDLQITPIQLLTYIDVIANGGKLFTPHLNAELPLKVSADLTSLAPQIEEVQKGMRQTVTSKLGTANILNDLPVTIGAKTGSAQIQNNTAENAFFVGYAPFDNPQVAILILVERSHDGSLNAVPIAKDIFRWYYEHRINPRSAAGMPVVSQ